MDVMKKYILISIFIIAAMGGFVYQMSHKQQRAVMETKGAIPVSPGIFQISGNVTQINLKNYTLTIFNEVDGWPVFAINEKTTFFKKDKNMKSENIKPGDFISITYENARGKNIAKSVTYTAPTAKKKSR